MKEPKKFSQDIACLNAGILKGLIDAHPGKIGLLHNTPTPAKTKSDEWCISLIIASDNQAGSLKNIIKDIGFAGVKLDPSSYSEFRNNPSFELVGQIDSQQFTQKLLQAAAKVAQINPPANTPNR